MMLLRRSQPTLLDLSIGSELRWLLADSENRHYLKFTGWMAVFGPSWEHLPRHGKVAPEWFAQRRAYKTRTPGYIFAPWPCNKNWS